LSGPALERDVRWMRQAVLMATRGLGTTAPNPSVGAVLVRHDLRPDGVLIARAVTQPGGRPHAETEALAAAGEAARMATLYVTLEPCSHHGKTPPCAEAVIAAGVTRVVVGIEDPDPRVAGRGIAMLRAAGIEVVVGVEAKACRRVTLGHILRVTECRPAVLLKMALRGDLTVPTGEGGQPVFATGPEARAAGHLLRAQSDAILVGAGTVRDDDPELTCRLPGLAWRSPKRIVLDGTLGALTPATKLARTAQAVPVWVMTTAEAPHDRRKALEDLGVRVSVVGSREGRPNIDEVVARLADDGVTRLMVEGGPQIWRTFANRQFLDEAVVFVKSGLSSINPMTFEGITGLDAAARVVLAEQGIVGADNYFRFECE